MIEFIGEKMNFVTRACSALRKDTDLIFFNFRYCRYVLD